jgi:hypothetical protein
MTDMESVRKPGSGAGLLVAGVVLLAIGIIGIIVWITIASQPSAGNEDTGSGVLQSLVVIAAALFTGVGAVMVTLGLIKRRRKATGAEDRASR